LRSTRIQAQLSLSHLEEQSFFHKTVIPVRGCAWFVLRSGMLIDITEGNIAEGINHS
jgi:hypothetical protein